MAKGFTLAVLLVLVGFINSLCATDCFYGNIAKLAASDNLLYSRHDEKHGLISKNVSKAGYLEIMRKIKSSGKTFACGYTRGWIAEILQGLSSQYDEFKVKSQSGWPAAGYLNVTGNKVVDLFNSNLNSPNRILYKFQIVGPLDHVWMVEQLAVGGGYRVYQSYNNAFSLKAWLAKGNLKALHGTDIIIWHDVIKMANNFLKKYGASISDLDNLPAALQGMKPWLVHIRDYNLTQVESEFRKAWSVVGQGRIMSKDYFYKNYLQVLANLTEAIIPFVSTTKPWTRELHDKWTSLFGAPNPVLYPGYPFNTLTAQYSQNFALEVRALSINSTAEAQCQANADILAASLTDCFYDNIAKLASSDALLYSRHDEKHGLISKNVAKASYLEIMRKIKSSGNTFACGYTRGWIAEILQGLSSQYDEFKVKNQSGWPAAGYLNVTGNKVVDLFNSNLNSPNRILYKFQIVGPLDHVWMVEQLAVGGGYRVYQSYNNAFSLKAWLAKGNLKALHGTDIIIWHDVIKMANNFLKKYGASISDLDNLPAALQGMKPWLVHIRDYNLTQVESEFRKAWSVVGQGRIMSKDYFYKNYLQVLANLTEAIIPFVSTTKPWTRELHDKWTSLFGAPNPVLYPGYPFNTLTAQYSQNFALEVRALVINSTAEAQCQANADILAASLTDCFFDTVKKLSNFDALLNSRLDEKYKLIKAGTNKENWLRIMRSIRSSGKAFSCGFTRSWIAEILQGLPQQYSELVSRNNSGTTAAGFVNVTGAKVVDLFHRNVGSKERILYKFQIVGPLDHVWLVEQLPFGGGYRVYQSYNNAYSLKAWLATGDLKPMFGSDVIVWHDVVRMAANFLKAHGGSMDNLDNLPGSVCAMKPWLVFIRDYNLTQVEANLKLAASKFGQGKISKQDFFFKNYVYVLGNLTEAVIPFVSTTKSWTQALHDKWTSLFGSPNPVLYPGFPFNQLTASFSQKYALEVRVLKISPSKIVNESKMAEGNCPANGAILEKSLHCFFDGVKEFVKLERKLGTRLDKMLETIRAGTNQSEFVRIMRDYKVSSTAAVTTGHPSYWINEILTGLPNQFNELSAKGNGVLNVSSNQLLEIFQNNSALSGRVLYHFSLDWQQKVFWVVEQLSFGRGYRVYQSNQDAFTQNAWLQRNDISPLGSSDLFTWSRVRSEANGFLQRYGASLSNLVNVPASLKPWMMSIRDQNMTQVNETFRKSWSSFGKGRILPKAWFFEHYLTPLSKLNSALSSLAGTSKAWNPELQKEWSMLFGSPNPWMYPGVPVDSYNGSILRRDPLQLRVSKISAQAEANCPLNVAIIRRSTELLRTTPRPTTAESTVRVVVTTKGNPRDTAAGNNPAFMLVALSTLLTALCIL